MRRSLKYGRGSGCGVLLTRLLAASTVQMALEESAMTAASATKLPRLKCLHSLVLHAPVSRLQGPFLPLDILGKLLRVANSALGLLALQAESLPSLTEQLVPEVILGAKEVGPLPRTAKAAVALTFAWQVNERTRSVAYDVLVALGDRAIEDGSVNLRRPPMGIARVDLTAWNARGPGPIHRRSLGSRSTCSCWLRASPARHHTCSAPLCSLSPVSFTR
jgi:hypothetical protein